MLIYLVRHGIAEDVSEAGDDASRVLTPEGIRKTREVAKGLSRFIEPPDVLLCSPKLRAKQTAQIIGDALDITPKIETKLGEEDVKAILDLLQHISGNAIAIVGHEPTLGYLIDILCTGSNQHGFVQPKKASVACIEIQRSNKKFQGPGQLLWYAPPRMLAAIAGD